MADLLRGPVSVANLTAAAGVTTTDDGWWPCLDLTWLTPVPATITKIVAQVRELGTTSPVAETVMTAADLTAGAAKVVNGVSVGQHLEVRLSPAGAAGLRFQPTPWVEVTTEWDALMAALEGGLSLGCIREYCGDGAPTIADAPIGSRYTREDVSQLWRAVAGLPAKAAICFAVDRSVFSADVYAVATDALSDVLAVLGTAIDDGAEYDICAVSWGSDSATTSDLTKRAATASDCTSLDSFIAGQTLNSDNTNPTDALTSAKAFFDATDAGFTQRYLFVLTDGDIKGFTPSTVGAACASLLAAMPDVLSYAMQIWTAGWATHITPDELMWMATYDNTAVDSIPTFTDDAPGLEVAILAGLDSVRWRRMSDLTSIRANGTEVEAEPLSLDVVDANGVLVATSDGDGAVTLTLNTDTDDTLSADSDAKVATQKAVKAYVDANAGGASALDDLSDVDTTTTAPSTGDVLTFDGTDWVPDAPSGGGSGSITASGYTQSTSKILGRTTASAGAIEEIAPGPGLVLADGVLSATGAGSLFVFKPPTTTLFSLQHLASGAALAINQGSSYYTISRSDAGASGERVCFQGKAVPAGTSWTATIGFWSTPYGRTNKCRTGLSLIESATLKSLNLFHNTEAGSPELDIFAYTNLTTFSSAPYNSAKIFGGRQAWFMRVTYNGTSYIFALSDNFGETFTTIATLAKATYFTTAADRIGVALDTGTTIVANECRMEIFYYSDPDF